VRFIKLNINNFRILRDVNILFSNSIDKKLTVVRAQNETGKTTLLTALQWVLYGENGLPNKGKNYRLHPIDWSFKKNSVASIEVSLEFEAYSFSHQSIATHRKVKRYLLERYVEERDHVTGWERMNESLSLHEFKNGEYKQIVNAETILRDMLPVELREIFFTDGDRALSFIEADVTTQRKRVKEAVKSLLGLHIVDNTIAHLKKEVKFFETEIQKIAQSSSLDKVCLQVERTTTDLRKAEMDNNQLIEKLEFVESKIKDIEVNIHKLLVKGNKKDLQKKALQLQKEQRRLETDLENLEKKHSLFYNSRELPLALLSPFFKKGIILIEDELEKDIVPSATITAMKQLIESRSVCLCGESLNPCEEKGQRRLEYLQKIVKSAIEQGNQSRSLADIKYIARQLLASSQTANETWTNNFNNIYSESSDCVEFLEEKMQERRELNNQIQLIPDVDVSYLVAQRNTLNNERDDFRIKQDRVFRQLNKLKQEYYKCENEKKELMRNEKINAKIFSELQAAQDLLTVFLSSYATIMNIELRAVSEIMNKYFMEMIGSSGDDKTSIIVNSEITQAFDIKVYGPNGRSLDPDKDLNGASRRALTISLILALTTVSGVKAPNIIDTPLGMMSGHVKKFVCDCFIKYSSQPILFLTRDEIAGCEDIITEHLGAITTLSNPVHYPRSLKNKPSLDNIQIMTCKCDHTQYCDVCERVGDGQSNNLQNQSVCH